MKQWALEPTGWSLSGEDKLFDISLLNNDEKEYEKMAQAVNPYGDGNASVRIVDIIQTEE